MTLPSLIHTSRTLLLFVRRSRSSRRCCRCCLSSRCCCPPVVQVMCDAVTVAAFRELAHDAGCVRHAVAILAFRHHLVLLLVTGYAEQGFVLGLAGDEHVVCFCVAGRALLGRCVSSVHDILRLVSLVALLAVAGALVSRVSLVALRALRNLAVDIVAERAGELGVLARICLQLCDLRGVAGEARISDITTEKDLFRLVRILVALETAAEFVVRLPFVALAAEGDDLPDCRRVAIVAVLAGYLCLVSSTLGFDVGRRLCMTLDAVGAGQCNCRFCRCCRRCCLRSCRFGCYCYRSKQKQG
jgi:hypothetical protein